jgi:hypothetical protein
MAQGSPPILINRLRDQRISWKNPLMPLRVTFRRRAMELVTAVVERYFNLAPGERSLTQNAESPIVQGTPPARPIFHPQDRQSIV